MNVRTPSPARDTDPVTSHEAADSVNRLVASDVHRAVLYMMRDGSQWTDEELCRYYNRHMAVYGWPPQAEGGPRKRRSELVDAGLVEDSGQWIKNSRGRRVVLWRITGAGRDALRTWR